jgi:hypothetical protein
MLFLFLRVVCSTLKHHAFKATSIHAGSSNQDEQPGSFAWFQTQANDFTEGQLESYKVQSIVECNV